MNAKDVESPVAKAPAAAQGGGGERGSLAYLLGAVGLIAIVAVLVMVFGVVHPPALPSLKSAGVTPPGGVAWTQWDDVDDCTALMVARQDGSVDRLACDDNSGDVLAWTKAGVVTLSWVSSGAVLLTRDPISGEVVNRDSTTGDYAGDFGSNVTSFRRDGKLVVTLEPLGRELWTVAVRRGYEVRVGAMSPDGGWVAMTDTADRLLLVLATGGDPVVWASGASNSWMAPVWEGTPIPSSISDQNKGK